MKVTDTVVAAINKPFFVLTLVIAVGMPRISEASQTNTVTFLACDVVHNIDGFLVSRHINGWWLKLLLDMDLFRVPANHSRDFQHQKNVKNNDG